MRSIGRHVHSRVKADYVATCGYCGMPWLRSSLRIDGSGLYVCPQEGKGRDAATLDEINQARTPNN